MNTMTRTTPPKSLVGQRKHMAQLNSKLSVEFIYEGDAVKCYWDPGIPKSLTQKEAGLYRTARDAFMASLASELGGGAIIIE
jgi:hypothetical protein